MWPRLFHPRWLQRICQGGGKTRRPVLQGGEVATSAWMSCGHGGPPRRTDSMNIHGSLCGGNALLAFSLPSSLGRGLISILQDGKVSPEGIPGPTERNRMEAGV